MVMEKNKKIRVIQTAKYSEDRLSEKEEAFFKEDTKGRESHLINIYDDMKYQEIEGFGGALTEACSTTLDKMSVDKRKEVINACFNKETGLGYSFCRTHINSCDFSLGNYAYVEKEDDMKLESFSIERDRKSLIPFIKEAMVVSKNGFKLFASPWSPPAWMKTTGKMNGGGKLKEEYKEAWALYYAKYIKAYAQEGIDIWAITVQNEPKAVQRWDSCIYTAEEERDFVRDYLGPILEKEGLGHIKIIIWDHNKERVFERANVAYSDKAAEKYIWGTGFHWYSGDHFESLRMTNERYPEKKLLMTEGCTEGGVKLGSWDAGEKYGHNIVGDLNNWAVAWTDWNMVLDEMGGPNHVQNFCGAPIIADTKENSVNYQSPYYYIGHFSKFIQPGARRIGFSRFTDKLEVTAFKNPNGEIIAVVMNQSEESIPFALRYEEDIAELESQPRSIMTLIY